MLTPASENVAILLCVTSAALIIKAATAPPLASPSFMFKSSIGSFFNFKIIPLWPGSYDKWEIRQCSKKFLSKIVKVAAEAVDTKPSNSTGIPLTLAAITDPAIAAISLPP